MSNETIFALSSGSGRSAIAVVRISGSGAGPAIARLTGRPPAPPRRAVVRSLRDGRGEELDRGLVLWFPGPASVTGEDVAEFHVHGGRACVDGVLAALGALDGLRPAEAGEFTRRAFVNGRLDLTQAEALADLVAAETAAQRQQALRQAGGALGRLIDVWRARLITLAAHLEAVIDFADEELPEGLEAAVTAGIADLAAEIGAHLADGRRGERLRDGIRVAVVGAPNAGKSSLFNALAGREAAIVSPLPGTTRDVIEVSLDIGGYPLVLADTAGLRDGGDAIEAEGVRRAQAWAQAAAVRLVIVDGAKFPAIGAETVGWLDDDAIVVVSKSDLGAIPEPVMIRDRPALAVSARTGAGLAALVSALTERLGLWFARGGEAAPPALTRIRHRQGLEDCRLALGRAMAVLGNEERAEELRAAATALGRITGRIDVEAVLDVVFRDFCIGK